MLSSVNHDIIFCVCVCVTCIAFTYYIRPNRPANILRFEQKNGLTREMLNERRLDTRERREAKKGLLFRKWLANST